MKFCDAIKVNGKATINQDGYVTFNEEGTLVNDKGTEQTVNKDYFDCDDWEVFIEEGEL